MSNLARMLSRAEKEIVAAKEGSPTTQVEVVEAVVEPKGTVEPARAPRVEVPIPQEVVLFDEPASTGNGRINQGKPPKMIEGRRVLKTVVVDMTDDGKFHFRFKLQPGVQTPMTRAEYNRLKRYLDYHYMHYTRETAMQSRAARMKEGGYKGPNIGPQPEDVKADEVVAA